MRIFLVVVVCVCAVPGLLHCQDSVSLENGLNQVFIRMQDGNLRARESSFSDLLDIIKKDGGSQSKGVLAAFLARHPAQAERLKLALIHQLETEDAEFVSVGSESKSHTEDDEEYYAGVVGIVSSLDDERAVPALVGAMTTGGIAASGLAKYGDKALGPILSKVNDANPTVRMAALQLSVMLLTQKQDAESQYRIASIVRPALSDSYGPTRVGIISLIGCLDGRKDYVPLLEQMAKSDPFKLPGNSSDGGDGEGYFPVRYTARRVLRDIQANKKCN